MGVRVNVREGEGVGDTVLVEVLVCVSVMVGVMVALRVGGCKKPLEIIIDPSPLDGVGSRRLSRIAMARLSAPPPSFIKASM